MSRSNTIRSLSLSATFSAAVLSACGGGGAGAGEGVHVPAARSSKVRVTGPAVASDDLTQVAADNRHFAVDLYQAVRDNPGNLVFSPASISIALAMTFGGARTRTATQMATTLRFGLPAERLHPAFNALDLALNGRGEGASAGAFRLSVVNALWAQRDFAILPAYLDLLAENYGAGVNLVDFSGATETARLTINQWVSEQTAAKIPELLKAGILIQGTRLVLTNAVYFHADWASPFAPKSQDGTFQTPAGPVTVPMMSGPGHVPLWAGDGYQAAAIPYVGGSSSMVLIVPDTGTFSAFEAALTADALDTILAAQTGSGGPLSMPRFKFKGDFSLEGVLNKMGMPDAFNPADADLSGIDGARDLYIGAVVHQAMIAVDEKGTEAAAATAVVINTTSAALNFLVVDRPFLFAIRDDATGSILFLGRVLDPSR